MVILDQSKPISLYLKIKKFVNCTFIIHKNGNKTSIQPILKSNSTSFIFNKKNCEIKGKKVIHQEGGLGEWGTVQIASLKCNFGIYLDIQAITTLLCLLLVLYVFVPSIYSFFYLTTALLKSDIFRHSNPLQPSGFIVKRKQVRITNYIGIPIN